MQFVSSRWWDAHLYGEDPSATLIPLFQRIKNAQEIRYQGYLKLAQVYGADMSARGGSSDPFRNVFDEELSLNELANTIETLHAQIFKNRIIPVASSVGGEYDQQRRAENLSRWIRGVCDDVGLHLNVIPKAGLQALIYGTGIPRVGYEVTGDSRARITITCEDAMDCFVDPAEARNGKTRCFYQRTQIDRQQAVEDYVDVEFEGQFGTAPDREKLIMEARRFQDGADSIVTPNDLETDEIFVYEAWHLPTAMGKHGRYVVCTDNGCLVDRDYKARDLPHAFIRFNVPASGFWGDSAVARIAPAQKCYDKLSQRIDLAHDIMGIPRIIIRKDVGISKGKIDDMAGSIIEVEGDINSSIREWNAVPITGDSYKERDSLPTRMRSTLGISGFSATGQLPTQLREASGVAVEAWEDSESARHAMLHRYYEAAVCDLVYRIVDMAIWLDEEGFNVQSTSQRADSYEVINFSDVKMDRDEFKLSVLPVSSLSKTFTGKVQQLSPLLERGVITISTFRKLTEMPDIEAQNDLDTASEEIIDKNLYYMLEEQKYLPPLAFDDLDLIVKRGTAFINLQRVKGVDETKLAPISQYIDDAVELKKKASAALQPTPVVPPMGGMPPAGAGGGMQPGGM